jgi:hypothetical protein
MLDTGYSFLDEGQKILNMRKCINRVSSIQYRVSISELYHFFGIIYESIGCNGVN